MTFKMRKLLESSHVPFLTSTSSSSPPPISSSSSPSSSSSSSPHHSSHKSTTTSPFSHKKNASFRPHFSSRSAPSSPNLAKHKRSASSSFSSPQPFIPKHSSSRSCSTDLLFSSKKSFMPPMFTSHRPQTRAEQQQINSSFSYSQNTPDVLSLSHPINYDHSINAQTTPSFIDRVIAELIVEYPDDFELKQQYLQQAPSDSVLMIERNLHFIQQYFQLTKLTLQEAFTSHDIEFVFTKRQQLIIAHELLERCNTELENYMSILEAEKTSSPTSNNSKPLSRKKSSNSSKRLVKAADKIGEVIPEMRELYILSQNFLKRLDLSAEWNELYNVITSGLELETCELEKELAMIKEQIVSSGLSALVPSTKSCSSALLSSGSKSNLTEIEFLLQAVLENPTTSGCRTIPYINGAQKIVVTRFYAIQAKLRPLDIAIKCLPDRMGLFEAKAINVYPRSFIQLTTRYADLRERFYGLSKECLKLSEELGDELHWNELFVGLCSNAERTMMDYERASSDSSIGIRSVSTSSIRSTTSSVSTASTSSANGGGYKISIQTKNVATKTNFLKDLNKIMSLINGMVKQKAIKNPRLIHKRDILQEKLFEIKHSNNPSSFHILFDPAHKKSSIDPKSTLKPCVNASSPKYCLLPLPRKNKPNFSNPSTYASSSRNVSGASTDSTVLSEDSLMSSALSSHYRTVSSSFTSPSSSPKSVPTQIKTPIFSHNPFLDEPKTQVAATASTTDSVISTVAHVRNDSVLQENALPVSHSSGSGKTLTPPTPPYINNTPLYECPSYPPSNATSPVRPPQLNPSFSSASVALYEETKNSSPRHILESGVEFSDPFSTNKGDTAAALRSIETFSSPRLTPVPPLSFGNGSQSHPQNKLQPGFVPEDLFCKSPTLDPRVIGSPKANSQQKLLPELAISPSGSNKRKSSELGSPSKYSVQIVRNTPKQSSLPETLKITKSPLLRGGNQMSLISSRKASQRAGRISNKMNNTAMSPTFFPNDATTVTPGRVSQMHRYNPSTASSLTEESLSKAAIVSSTPCSTLGFAKQHKQSFSGSSRIFHIPPPQRLSSLFGNEFEPVSVSSSPMAERQVLGESNVNISTPPPARENSGKGKSQNFVPTHGKRASTSGFFARLSHTFSPETEFHVPCTSGPDHSAVSTPGLSMSPFMLDDSFESRLDKRRSSGNANGSSISIGSNFSAKSNGEGSSDESQVTDRRYRVMPSNLVIHRPFQVGDDGEQHVIASTPNTGTFDEQKLTEGHLVLEVNPEMLAQDHNGATKSRMTPKDGHDIMTLSSGNIQSTSFIPFTRGGSRPSSIASFSSVFSYTSSLAGNTSSGDNTQSSFGLILPPFQSQSQNQNPPLQIQIQQPPGRPQFYDNYIIPSPTAPTVFFSNLATEARTKKTRTISVSMSRSNSNSSYESLRHYQRHARIAEAAAQAALAAQSQRKQESEAPTLES